MKILILSLVLSFGWTTKIDRSYYIGKHGFNSIIDMDQFFSNSTELHTRKSKDGFMRRGDASIKIQTLKKSVVIDKWNDNLEHILERIDRNDSPREDKKSPETELEVAKSTDPENVTSGRFLGLFEVVNFENVDCVSTGGLRGKCLHGLECTAVSGIDGGSCAQGFGICCIFQYTCDSESSSMCATFTNPGFPRPSGGQLACTFTLNKASKDIRQLRIDFVQMELRPPTNGSCVEDQFIVSGQNINSVVPILCGINTGQHVLVDVGETLGPIYLSVLSGGSEQRLFHLEVCQITGEVAPPGCLQYMEGPQGVLESFNYQMYSTIPSSRPPAPSYYNNLNYAICIKRAPYMCSVTYSNDGDSEFQILNYYPDGMVVIPPGQAGAEVFNCPDDYIVVNGIRLCGERLNDASITEDFTMNVPVTEMSNGPIVFIFRTNGNGTGRGFRLQYKQNPCASSSLN